jgi:hypothetical protein
VRPRITLTRIKEGVAFLALTCRLAQGYGAIRTRVAAIDWLQQMGLDDATELLREPASHAGKHMMMMMMMMMMMRTHQVLVVLFASLVFPVSALPRTYCSGLCSLIENANA